MRFASKEGLALINGTTAMTSVAALLWVKTNASLTLRALLGAVALSIEAMRADRICRSRRGSTR